MSGSNVEGKNPLQRSVKVCVCEREKSECLYLDPVTALCWEALWKHDHSFIKFFFISLLDSKSVLWL